MCNSHCFVEIRAVNQSPVEITQMEGHQKHGCQVSHLLVNLILQKQLLQKGSGSTEFSYAFCTYLSITCRYT